MRTWCAILLAGLAGALVGCQPAAPEPPQAPATATPIPAPKHRDVFVNPLERRAPQPPVAPREESNPSKFRGMFVYLWQHPRARAAAGCKDETDFAQVVSADLKTNYGANTVVVVGQPIAPDGKRETYEQIVRAYVAQGMYVVIYVQGPFFYRGAMGEKWTDADAEKFIADYLAYLHRFDDLGDKVLMTIISEEEYLLDTRDGKPMERVVSPRLRQIWKATKAGSRWPVAAVISGYGPSCRSFANLPDDERPDVCLVETYEPFFVDGANRSATTPTRAQITSGKYYVAGMVEAARQELQTAQSIFRGKCEVGHVPLMAGIPAENLTGKGWELPMVLGYYLPQMKLYSGKYQFGWGYLSTNAEGQGAYVGFRDQSFKLTPVGKELLGCWKEDAASVPVSAPVAVPAK